MVVGICVPTLNAGNEWESWLTRVKEAAPAGTRLLVIDSSSDDTTAELARHAGFQTIVIPRSEFNHGATRQLAVETLDECDVIVLLTQDALLESSDAISKLIRAFENDKVGVAYGRQLPHRDAGPFGAHARLFNYPTTSSIRNADDISCLGIKTAFVSNSFAAYRHTALTEVGGFPRNLILAEDMVVAARMVLKGWHIAYVADAEVFHSHDYTMLQEFRRYFDTGVLHAREPWLLEQFGKPEGEGVRFVRSQLKYLLRRTPWLLPSALLRTLLKYAGYRLGGWEQHLPFGLKRSFSMHKGFWRSSQDDL